jgi:hypothetical protein
MGQMVRVVQAGMIHLRDPVSVEKQAADRVDGALARHGGLSYLEIPAIDIAKSAAFYHEVVGWEVRDDDPEKFSDATGHLIGRWVTCRESSRKPGLVPYIYVDRIDEAISRVGALGGEIAKAPYPEGNLRVAAIRDPAGNLIGLWQDANR